MTIMFQRPPFHARQVTVMVPWNRMVTMETVKLAVEGRPDQMVALETERECQQDVVHDYRQLKPTVVHSTWQHIEPGTCSLHSTVMPESQVCQYTLKWWQFLPHDAAVTSGVLTVIVSRVGRADG